MSKEVAAGHVSVFPVFKGMRKAISKEVGSGVKDAEKTATKGMASVGRNSGLAMGRGVKTAFTKEASNLGGTALQTLQRDVATTSRALSAARMKQADDAGRVRVAEQRLAEAIAKHGEGSSQAIAAEERLASARRALESSTTRVTTASGNLQAAQSKLTAAQDAASASAGRTGSALARMASGVRAGVSGLAGVAATAYGRIVDGAKRAASAVGSAFATGVKGAATTAVASVGAGIGVAFVKGIGRLTAIDVAQAKLRGLGNNAKTVSAIISDALKSVRGTSFGLGEAAGVAAAAVAAGIKPGEALQRHLKSIANNASAAGVSMDEMGSIFNKAATQANGVQNDVISQLADKGIPIYQALADQLGVTAGEVFKMASDGKIDFETFSKAATAAAGTVADEMGKTVPGALSNFFASLGRIGANVLGGVYSKLGPLIAAATSALGPVEEKAKQLGDLLLKVLGPAMDWVTNLLNGLGAGTGLAGSGLERISGLLGPLAGAFTALGAGGLAGVLSKLPLLGSLLPGLGGALAALGGPLGILAGGLAGLVLSGGDVSGLVSGLTGIIGQVVAALPGLVQQVATLVPQIVSSILSQVPALLDGGLQIVQALITGIVSSIPVLTQGAVQLISGLVQALVTNLPMIIQGAVALVGGVIRGIVTALPQLINAGLQIVQALLRGLVAVIPQLAQGAVGLVQALVSALIRNLPLIIQGALSLVTGLVQGLVTALPLLLNAAIQIVTALVTGLVNMLPQLVQGGLQLLTGLITAVVQAIPLIINALLQLLPNVVTTLLGMLPKLLQTGIQLFIGLVQAVVKIVPQLLQTILGMLPKILQTLIGMLPQLLQTGVKLFLQLVMAVIDVLPKLLTQIIGMLPKIISTVIGMLPKLLEAAVQLFMALVKALPKVIPELVSAIIDMAPKLVNAVIDMVPELLAAGKDLIRGLVNGIASMGQAVLNAIGDIVGGAIDWAKDLLGIASPSKVFREIARFVGEGFIRGLKGSEAKVQAAAKSMIDKIRRGMDSDKISRSAGQPVIEQIKSVTARIVKAVRDREGVLDKLAQAKDRLKGLVAERADYISGVRESVQALGNITGFTSAKDMIANVKKQLAATKAFRETLAKLSKLGLDDASRDELMAQFLQDGSTASADALLAGGKKSVQELAKLRGSLDSQAKALGSSVGDQMFKAGIESARGLVEGLRSQAKRLKEVAEGLADSLVKALRKKLGIKSPSRVLRGDGRDTGEGYALGLEDKAHRVQRAALKSLQPDLESAAAKTRALGANRSSTRVEQLASQLRDGNGSGVTIMGDVYTRDEAELVRMLDQRARMAYYRKNALQKVG